MSTVVLRDRDCARMLAADGAVERVAAALTRVHTELARGGAGQPLPAPGRDPHDRRAQAPAVVPMVGHAPYLQRSAVKLLADAPANRVLGRPAQRSTITLYDSTDAACLAVADGRAITRVRTAVVTALATRALARPGRVLGLVGAGPLAVEHVRAHRDLTGVREVVVWSRSAASRARFADDVAGLVAGLGDAVRVTAVTEVHEVFEAADVVCTLTPAEVPLVSRKLLRPGMHVTALGSPPRPEFSELDPDVFEDVDRVVVDDVDVARHESGNVRGALAAGTLRVGELVTLGAVLAGDVPGRRRDSDVTLFNSVGLGVQDLAVLDLLHREAVADGTGERVALRD